MTKLALDINGHNIPNLPHFGEGSLTDFSLGGIASGVLNIIFYIAGLMLFIWLIWGIMQYIFAGGNKEGLAKARQRITYALIGFFIVVLSYTLSQYVQGLSQAQTPDITKITPP